jgi:cation diffusion facilitator CzcD-associated flavoprotein CzcO
MTPRVVVVGAGFGGIATGVKLKRAGLDSFTIYESSLGIGGTWWDNTYPGCEVDVRHTMAVRQPGVRAHHEGARTSIADGAAAPRVKHTF